MEDEEEHDQFPESSQVNLFQDEDEEEDDSVDRLTQARTQVEQLFMPQTKKARAEAAASQDADVSKYNPKPDQEELVEVRQAYADLNTKFSHNRAELVDHSGTDKVIEMVAAANATLGKIHTTNEATLDSRFISSIAELGAEKIQKLPFSATDFTLGDFINLLKSSLKQLEPSGMAADAPDPWFVIGQKGCIHWMGVSSCDFLCGPIAVAPKERPERRPQKRVKTTGPAKEIDGMAEDEFEEMAAATSNTATSNNVIAVAKILGEFEGPVPFHAFISNPDSFAKSVENLFYCSFLVAEGVAGIEMGPEDGEIYISHIGGDRARQTEEEKAAIRAKHQHVFNFSMHQWSAAIRKWELTEPLIDF